MTDQELDRLLRRALLDAADRRRRRPPGDGDAAVRGAPPPYAGDAAGPAAVVPAAKPLPLAHRGPAGGGGAADAVAVGGHGAGRQPQGPGGYHPLDHAAGWPPGGVPLSRRRPRPGSAPIPDRRPAEGYTETERIAYDSFGSVRYENAEGNAIELDYMYMQDGVSSGYTLADGDVKREVSIAGMPGMLLISTEEGRLSYITWMDAAQNISFQIIADADESVIITMAESVSLCGPTN